MKWKEIGFEGRIGVEKGGLEGFDLPRSEGNEMKRNSKEKR